MSKKTSKECDFIEEKLRDLMEDDYLSAVSLVAIVIDDENDAFSIMGDGCLLCVSELLIKYIKENNVKHNNGK